MQALYEKRLSTLIAGTLGMSMEKCLRCWEEYQIRRLGYLLKSRAVEAVQDIDHLETSSSACGFR